jgi:hypothetical protein
MPTIDPTQALTGSMRDFREPQGANLMERVKPFYEWQEIRRQRNLWPFSKSTQKAPQIDRLGVEVGAAHLDAFLPVARQRMRGQCDDRYPFCPGVCLDEPCGLPAVHFAQGALCRFVWNVTSSPMCGQPR